MDTQSRNKKGSIAIVGIGGVFPGSLGFKDFWLNILKEKDFIRDVPPTYWLKEEYFDPDAKTNGTYDKVYCKRGAFLEDISFDPVEFGMPPNILNVTDTVQLLSLVAAREVLNDTVSFRNGNVDKKKVSVILGVAAGTELIGQMSARIRRPEWVYAMRKQGLPESKIQNICDEIASCYTPWTENTFPGLLSNVVSGRVANRFDLGGTNCVIDAACASSLGALKMAVQELQLGDADMVISGGADALNDIFMYMCFSKTTALSATGDCRPFSDNADGTVLGEGVTLLTLKRLEDAERDSDKIYAIITSIGSSSDGKSKSIYAPDAQGQSYAIKRAYEKASISPNDIQLIEAHATGTIAGDLAEFNGLRTAFGKTKQKQYCAIGSVKSQIGHTKSAAGATSLMKVCMALNNAILPPTIKINKPNPELDIENSPFYLNTSARPWIHESNRPRKAGVSAMGFGGTNFHVVVEEYKGKNALIKNIYLPGKELFLISGNSGTDIINQLKSLQNEISEKHFVPVARQSQFRFDNTQPCRLALLAKDADDLGRIAIVAENNIKQGEKSFEIPYGSIYSEEKNIGKTAFLFSGQGSQYLHMGSDILKQFRPLMEPWNFAASLKLDGHFHLNDVVFPIPVFTEEDVQKQKSRLVDTQWAQPAIGALALSHLELLEIAGVKPDMTAGHSYGEVMALYAAGILKTQADTLQISRKRGELMAGASGKKGAMTAVFEEAETIRKILNVKDNEIVIANYNSPGQIVLSGTKVAITSAEDVLERENIKFQRLSVSTAFHSTLVAPIARDFHHYLNTISFGKARMPVYCNTTGKPYPQKKEEIAKTLANQLANPVKFMEQVTEMYANGARTFIEAGPGSTLTHFVDDILADKPHTSVSIDGGKKQNGKDSLWYALGKMAVTGIAVSFEKIWDMVDLGDAQPVRRKISAVSVKINGSNYGKPYPPKGDLPEPNPENNDTYQVPHNIAGTKSTNKISVQANLQQYTDKITTDDSNNNIYIPTNQNQMNKKGMTEEWYMAFKEIQENMLKAHQSFQDTVAQNHRLFLETSQKAFEQLGKFAGHQNNQSGVENESFPVDNTEKTFSDPERTIQPPEFNIKQDVQETGPPRMGETNNETLPEENVCTDGQKTNIPSNQHQPNVKDTVLDIISKHTGYPKEILNTDMDLEADLGIDSIKRVQILSDLQEIFPELKSAETSKLVALNTLDKIIGFADTSGLTSNTGEAAGTKKKSLN